MKTNSKGDSFSRLLNLWRAEPSISENLVHWNTSASSSAAFSDFPVEFDDRLVHGLEKIGVNRLYIHQKAAWDLLKAGNDVAVTTSTASGKSLCYNLPVIDRFLDDKNACTLYLFPTKALAQDQEKALRSLLLNVDGTKFAEKWLGLYDGDTSLEKRRTIRKEARFVFSNPDMLHAGILPYHTSWARFFSNLRFVVIDEIHTYRGIFGSHVANVIRRLKRIANFYGSHPQFVMTSATIANPGEFSARLIESPVELVTQDGSPHGSQNVLLYNPPVIQKELGIRRSSASETIRLCGDLLSYGIQTLVFSRSRKSVEFTLKNLHSLYPDQKEQIFSYRSGYLPRDRRYIEKRIKDGSAKVIVSTNALELGIDIGSLDAIFMVGYPGTISGFRQQAGRAGRKDQESLVVMVASSKPLDQFLLKNTDYLFSKTVEHALINPDNLIILLQHIRCAVYELPFTDEESFGDLKRETLTGILEILRMADNIHYAGGKHFWVSDQYPAGEVSLRTAGEKTFLLQAWNESGYHNIGEIDEPSAYWMTHPQAIYMHLGQSYLVDDMDYQNGIVKMLPVGDDYYTAPRQRTSVIGRSVFQQEELPVGTRYYGEIQVTSQVTGYKKIDFQTNEILSTHQLEMPETQLITTGAWLQISDRVVNMLRDMNLWNADRNDYGPNWKVQRDRTVERDKSTCQVCGREFTGAQLHVHHKIPFKSFPSYLEANLLKNLITLCSSCHLKAETVIRIRSGLGGLAYVLHNLAPLTLMCSYDDIGVYADATAPITNGSPCVLIYDQVPAGIGLSESLYKNFSVLLKDALKLVNQCECTHGCPSCVGAPGEQAASAKQYTRELLVLLNAQVMNHA